MNEHNWQDIIEASRQLLDALRLNAGSVRRFDASQSQAEAIYAANVGRAIGHPASNSRVRMSQDPRCEGIMREDADVAGMFHALYANRPNVRLAALRLWRFYCRESIMRLLAPFKDSAERHDAIADLVNLGSADLAELDTAINQLALATGNLALPQVQAAASPPVELATRGFEVKAARIADELSRLADLLELIANGEADDISDGDGWQTRTDAGLLVARLQALLNYGDLDFADCDFPTLERLKSLWSSIKRLDFGDHSDRPKEYRGALFLPHELRPLHSGQNEFIPTQVLRGADEPYDAYEGFGKHWDGYLAARKFVAKQFPDAKQTETKREAWGWYPDKLRSYAKSLAKTGNAEPAAKQVASEVREADERGHRAIKQESPVPDSRPISKKVAARLHRGGPVANPTSYFNDLVGGKHLTAPVGSGQRWRFVVEEFPEPVRDQMR